MVGEVVKMTMESSKAPPCIGNTVHFGQDFLTAALTPAQLPAEDCIILIEEMMNAKKDT